MAEAISMKESIEVTNTWTLVAVSGGILLLYCMSRIIALQRRVRDVEARPPVDDIVMRGMIRQQVSEMVGELEQSIRVRSAVLGKPKKAVVPKPEEIVEKSQTVEVKEVKIAAVTPSHDELKPQVVAVAAVVAEEESVKEEAKIVEKPKRKKVVKK